MSGNARGLYEGLSVVSVILNTRIPQFGHLAKAAIPTAANETWPRQFKSISGARCFPKSVKNSGASRNKAPKGSKNPTEQKSAKTK